MARPSRSSLRLSIRTPAPCSARSRAPSVHPRRGNERSVGTPQPSLLTRTPSPKAETEATSTLRRRASRNRRTIRPRPAVADDHPHSSEPTVRMNALDDPGTPRGDRRSSTGDDRCAGEELQGIRYHPRRGRGAPGRGDHRRALDVPEPGRGTGRVAEHPAQRSAERLLEPIRHGRDADTDPDPDSDTVTDGNAERNAHPPRHRPRRRNPTTNPPQSPTATATADPRLDHSSHAAGGMRSAQTPTPPARQPPCWPLGPNLASKLTQVQTVSR